MNLDDFTAKNNKYERPKELPKNINNPVNNNQYNNNEYESFIKPDDTINLSGISIQKFYNNIQSSIDSKTPIFIWSKERQNNKIRLDIEKRRLILEDIQELRKTVSEVNNLNADIFFSEEYINNLILDNRMRAKHYFQLSVANHIKSLTEIETNIKLTKSAIEHDEIEKERKRKINEGLDAENKLKLADVEKKLAEVDSIKTQNELKKLIMSKIDFSKFPSQFMPDLIMALTGLNGKTVSEREFEDRINNIFADMQSAKAKMAWEEVNDFRNSAEFKKWKNQQAKKDAEL